MTITAKYSGTCRICARPVHVGDKIEWEKGRGSMHIGCSAKPAVPLNSPPPYEQIPADTDLAAEARKHGRKLVGEAKIIHLSSRVSRGEHCTAIGSIEVYRGKRLLVLARTRPVYLSEDSLEEMDMFDRQPGLWYEMSCVAVAPTSEEQAAQVEAAETKTAQKKAERDAHNAKIDTLTAGMVRICASKDMFTTAGIDCTESDPTWQYQAEGKSQTYASLHPLACGGFRHPHGGYDDYREDYYLTPDVVQKIIAARVADYMTRHNGDISAALEYEGCAGYEPEFVAALKKCAEGAA